MPKFIITHGSIILPKQGKEKQAALGIGESIELTEEERAHLDPAGTQLVSPEKFAEMRKMADAHKALEEAAKKEQPKAKAPAIAEKTLKALAELKPASPMSAPAPKKDGAK